MLNIPPRCPVCGKVLADWNGLTMHVVNSADGEHRDVESKSDVVRMFAGLPAVKGVGDAGSA